MGERGWETDGNDAAAPQHRRHRGVGSACGRLRHCSPLGDAETALDWEGWTSVRDALKALEGTHNDLHGELPIDGTIPATVAVLYDGTRVPNHNPDSVALAGVTRSRVRQYKRSPRNTGRVRHR